MFGVFVLSSDIKRLIYKFSSLTFEDCLAYIENDTGFKQLLDGLVKEKEIKIPMYSEGQGLSGRYPEGQGPSGRYHETQYFKINELISRGYIYNTKTISKTLELTVFIIQIDLPLKTLHSLEVQSKVPNFQLRRRTVSTPLAIPGNAVPVKVQVQTPPINIRSEILIHEMQTKLKAKYPYLFSDFAST